MKNKSIRKTFRNLSPCPLPLAREGGGISKGADAPLGPPEIKSASCASLPSSGEEGGILNEPHPLWFLLSVDGEEER
jgi:hypothetical protein